MRMGTKFIITETQYKMLKIKLNENNFHSHLVEKLVNDLNINYEPMLGIVRDNHEYFETPMIKVKVDDTETTPSKLFFYFKEKYNLGDDFIKQIIKDWLFGSLKGNQLSKNVPIK